MCLNSLCITPELHSLDEIRLQLHSHHIITFIIYVTSEIGSFIILCFIHWCRMYSTAWLFHKETFTLPLLDSCSLTHLITPHNETLTSFVLVCSLCLCAEGVFVTGIHHWSVAIWHMHLGNLESGWVANSSCCHSAWRYFICHCWLCPSHGWAPPACCLADTHYCRSKSWLEKWEIKYFKRKDIHPLKS